MKKLFLTTILLSFGLFLFSCGGGEDATTTDEVEDTEETTETEEATDETAEAEETETEEATQSIVELASGNENLSTLVKALQAAELVDALSGDGPFTVFAPTNEAFAALGETLDELLLPENKEKLAAILKYHVVSGTVMSGDLTDGQKAPTLNGAEVTVAVGDGVKLDDKANVTTADVSATNGVVHIIDAVITPAE